MSIPADKLLPVGVEIPDHMGPVIQARPFQIAVTQLKSQGANQVQGGTGGGAGAGDISRIGGDLRLYQHYMKGKIPSTKVVHLTRSADD
jgi:hypothetical protein